MNLCIYVFISFKGKTHVVFLFQICFHLIDRLRNIFKKHNDMIFLVFPNAHKQNDMLLFLLFVISGATESQPKRCPRRYPG